MYRKYLFSENEEQKQAFLAGFHAMMEVMENTQTEDQSILLSRRDPDWILMLCEKVRSAREDLSKQVAKAIVENYTVDKKMFRGFLLGTGPIGDDGKELHRKTGKVAKKSQPYPHRFYMGDYGHELTREEYEALPAFEQEEYIEVLKLKLTSKTGHDVKWIDNYNSAVIELLLLKVLPEEPRVIIDMYLEALQKGNPDIVLSDYTNVVLCANTASTSPDFPEFLEMMGGHVRNDYGEDAK